MLTENHRLRPRLAAAAAGLAVVLLASGCGQSTEQSGPSHRSDTTSPAPTQPSRPAPSETYTGIPAVTWGPETSSRVKARAAKVMRLFARPEVGYRNWFEDLHPFLRDEYAKEAEYVDPANIPVSEVISGPELLRQGGNPLTVTAMFETNAGPWSVLLHRTGQNEPWLVAAIEPTEAEPMKGRQ